MTRVTVPLHFTVEMFSQITGWQRRVLHPRLRSRLARRLTQTQLGHIHRFRWGGFRRRRRGAPTVEPSQCGTGNSQAKACEREITFPTASEQLRPHLTWGGGRGQSSLSGIIYPTAQGRPLALFDGGAGEGRAMGKV